MVPFNLSFKGTVDVIFSDTSVVEWCFRLTTVPFYVSLRCLQPVYAKGLFCQVSCLMTSCPITLKLTFPKVYRGVYLFSQNNQSFHLSFGKKTFIVLSA